MLVSSSEDKTVRLWQLKDGTNNILSTTNEGTRAVAFAPNNATVAYGNNESSIRIQDIFSKNTIRLLQGHSDSITGLVFSNDGSLLASSSKDASVRIWDIATGSCIQNFIGHSQPVWAVTFSVDNNLVVSSGMDETIRIWSIKSGECEGILRTKRPYEGMNIIEVQGLSESQIQHLKILGAVTED